MRIGAVGAVVLAAAGVCAWAATPLPSAPPASGKAPAVQPGKASASPEKAKAPEKKPPIELAWRTDLDAAREEAARTGRLLLIFFYADWCRPCKWMDEGTFCNRVVAQYIQRNFIPVRIDDSKEPSDVSRTYEIRVYPTILFLDSRGNPLHMMVRPRPPAEFYPVLAKVDGLAKLLEAHAKAPDDLEANFAVGNAYATLEPLNAVAPVVQLRRAEPYLKRAADLDPENKQGRLSQARLILALVPLADGDADAAMKNLDAYIREFKDAREVPVALHFQGTVRFQEGRYEEARAYYQRILREFPTHPKAYEADKALEAIDARLKAREAEKAAPAQPNPAETPAGPAAPKQPVG